MIPAGYSFVRLSDNAEVATYGSLPARVELRDDGGKVTLRTDLDKVGLVIPDDDAPTHKLVERVLSESPPDQPANISSESTRFDGEKIVVTRTYELLPVPPRKIDKAIILERLTDEQLSAALALMTQRQRERWRVPGYPSISVEDPDLLAVLAAIGADPAVVLAE